MSNVIFDTRDNILRVRDLLRQLRRLCLRALLFALELHGRVGILRDLSISVQFFLDKWVASSCALYISVGKCHHVGIFQRACADITAHGLLNDSGLILQLLPHIGVKGVLHDVGEYFYLFVRVALPDNTAFALFDVARPPRCVQMVLCYQMMLEVCASSHFLCRADNDADFAVVYFLEKLVQLLLLCTLSIGNLITRNTMPYQAGNESRIDCLIFLLCRIIAFVMVFRRAIGFLFCLRYAHVAEDSLRAFNVVCRVELRGHLLRTCVYLLVRHGELSQVVGKSQHVIVALLLLATASLHIPDALRHDIFYVVVDNRINRQRDNRAFTAFKFRQFYVRVFGFQFITREYIRKFSKALHEFRHIDKAFDLVYFAIAVAVRFTLDTDADFCIATYPVVEDIHVVLFEAVAIQIAHHGVHLRHCV